MKSIVWMKDDLRLHDSPAVCAALRNGAASITVVRTDGSRLSHVRPTARRLAHETEAIESMRSVLERSGSRLVTIGSETDDLLETCAALGASTIHANTQVGDELGHARDRAVARKARAAGVRYVEHAADGVQRGSRAEAAACVTSAKDLAGLRFEGVPAALGKLRHYLARLPNANYRRDMWLPGPDASASSRLSVDLACGMLSGDRVLREIEDEANRRDPWTHRAYQEFANRIHWRRQFVQMLEKNVDAFPWGPTRAESVQDAERLQAWRRGETGYPLVDAAMRDLHATGWINFRLRQTVCSFAIDLLGLDLHRVGVALGEMFDDYCPGIHWSQIALQSGMVPGRGPRIVNPVKQARELDPQGRYVKRLLPHLRDEPLERLFDPYRNSLLGGWPVIVDHERAARAARARHPGIKNDGQTCLPI